MKLPDWFAATLADGMAPAISRWLDVHERRILSEGDPLDEANLRFAEKLGIRSPGEIRVRAVETVPLPVPPALIRLGRPCGLPVFAPGAMAVGRGIYHLPDQRGSIPHELVHVVQYQRLGGSLPFMRRYLRECLSAGYEEAALEIEARERSTTASAATPPHG